MWSNVAWSGVKYEQLASVPRQWVTDFNWDTAWHYWYVLTRREKSAGNKPEVRRPGVYGVRTGLGKQCGVKKRSSGVEPQRKTTWNCSFTISFRVSCLVVLLNSFSLFRPFDNPNRVPFKSHRSVCTFPRLKKYSLDWLFAQSALICF